MSTITPVEALYPMLKSLFLISSMMTAGLTPVFSIILLNGYVRDFSTMRAPINSSSDKFSFDQYSRSFDIWVSVAPPPGTIPSSTAAFVAFIASSNLSFRSLVESTLFFIRDASHTNRT